MTETQERLDRLRPFVDKDSYKKIMKFFSYLDDILHLDFANLIYSKKNKISFDKTLELFTELSFLNEAYKKDGMNTFYNISNYNIHAFLIVEYLEDSDVVEFLNNDKRANKRLHNKYDEIINLLKEHTYIA